LIESFKELYELNQKFLKLEPLSEELEIIPYPDETFALNWWPHKLYLLEGNNIFDHDAIAMDKKRKKAHENYT